MTRNETIDGGLLSKWWMTDSAAKAFARAKARKAEKLEGLKKSLAKSAERRENLAREAMEWKEAA